MMPSCKLGYVVVFIVIGMVLGRGGREGGAKESKRVSDLKVHVFGGTKLIRSVR